MGDKFITEHKFNFEKKTWDIIDTFFADKKALVKHQLESYNDFIDNKIQKIINEFNPVISTFNFNEELGKYMGEYQVSFHNISISKPIINNEGENEIMYPSEARIRGLTYSASLMCDIHQKIIQYDVKTMEKGETELPVLKNISLGKIPIMINSKYCVLNELTNKTRRDLGEDEYDEGGYFIVNGSEKVLVSFERKCENKIFVFTQSKGPNMTYSHIAEITSVDYNSPAYLKPMSVKLTSKEGNYFGKLIRSQVSSKIKGDIPVFVIFRALGIISDKQIIDMIVYDTDNELAKILMDKLKPSLEEASPIKSKKVALEYISKFITVPITSKNNQTQTPALKLKYTEDILYGEILPHVGKSHIKKAYFLGLMIRKLLLNYLGYLKPDDRDSLLNKRIESPGSLMTTLFRANFHKLIKELKISLDKDIKNGRMDEISSNLGKKIKISDIENNIKYALSTGNWVIKGQTGGKNKTGVAQLMNRLSYASSLSHRRRIIAPIEKNAKQTSPRKLHNTQFGKACAVETPEGASIGLVKNLALMAHITLESNPAVIHECLGELGVISLEEVSPLEIAKNVNVFVNGDWVGIHRSPHTFVEKMIEMRRSGELHIYTSIAWNVRNNEININTDAGRLCRPLYIVENNDILVDDDIVNRTRKGEIIWNNLLVNNGEKFKCAIDFLDTQEEDTAMIAMNYENLRQNNPKNDSFYRYTHCEMHPSMMLGVLASNIPFPDHNQSPRNLFQAAMGKQAMGVYASNFNKRMDTISHVLHYPQKPLVNTRPSLYVNSNELPSGQNAIVAIMCHTGYNQEDSIMMNQDSVQRGLFNASSYRTYKDKEEKNQSTLEENKFCKPEKYPPNGMDYIYTKGMKQGSYEKLDPKTGFVKVGSNVNSNDVIIGKVLPLKQSVPTDPKYKDFSMSIKEGTEGVVDWVYTNKKDGYKFVNVRVRSERVPEQGDKFASRHGQKGTVGILYRHEDMPYTKDGIVPDLIINPLAIPSRMTIGQLLECLIGKACVLKGYEADATPFNGIDIETIGKLLEEVGYASSGTEIMYNGRTGEQLTAKIFIGPTFYYRLKHLVSDKIHSRSSGPYQLLTKQPAEGRSRDGGLRIGEMERDSLLAHGTSYFLKEKLFDCSDKFTFYICKNCGMIAIANKVKNIFICKYCDNTSNFAKVFVPYATKLIWQELMSMGIAPRLISNI